MKNYRFLLLLPLLLLSSCAQKVSQEDFEKAILEIVEHQYHEASLEIELSYEKDGKKNTETSSLICIYDENKGIWKDCPFDGFFEPLKKNGAINDKSAYHGFCETISEYQDYALFLRPFKITCSIDNELTKVSCMMIYDNKGYLTNYIMTNNEPISNSVNSDYPYYSKLEYSISYR